MSKEVKMLTFDSSTTSTGWSLYVNGVLKEYAVLSFSDIKDIEKRLTKMINEVYSLINSVEPLIIVTELTAVPKNAHTQRVLTLLLGAIQGKCVEKNIAYYSFRPTEWRKKISEEKKPRKREELKVWSKNKVKEIFNIEDINDDVSDAILLGQAYINLFRENKKGSE